MRTWFVWAILLVAAVAGVLSHIILFRMIRPPDQASAVLGGLWVATPFLAAAGSAILRRHHTSTLVVLLIALLVTGGVGVSLLNATATQQAVTAQQQRDAVQPGEDPDHGPAGMRKAGADVAVAAGGAFSILLVVVMPPAQVLAVLIPTVIASAVSSLARKRREGESGATRGGLSGA